MKSSYQMPRGISIIHTLFQFLILIQPIISFTSNSIQSHVRHDSNESHFISSFHNKCRIRIQNSLIELSATTAATPMSYSDGDTAKRMSFHKRMRDIALRREKRPSKSISMPPKKQSNRSRVITVESIEEYKKVVGDERNKITVVRFFATWCKSCKAMAPGFYRLSNLYPDIKFVQVPVTNKNTNLHQGLGVPSVPFGHIYHPTAGLVEEMKISRKYFSNFEDTLAMYVKGSCDLKEEGDCSSPFAPTDVDDFTDSTKIS